MRLEDYPILFTVSDSSSISARKKHFLLLKIRIALLLLGAILSIVWVHTLIIWFGYLMCLSLISIVTLRIWDQKGYAKIWHEGRAIAESVKENTWKFIMKVEPYNIEKKKSEKEFIRGLHEVRDFYKDTSSKLDAQIDAGVHITDVMLDIRSKNLKERIDYYLDRRVRDQQEWYSKRSKDYQNQKQKWDILRFLLEVIAVGFSLALLINLVNLNLVGVLTTATGVVLSWDQGNKYEELAKTYNFTAIGLSFLYSGYDSIDRESELSELVLAAEREISKEHTTWVSRRIV